MTAFLYRFLRSRVDTSQEGYTPLLIAAQEGHADFVLLMLQAKALVDVKANVSG